MVVGRDASRVGRCVAAMQGAGMTIVDVRTVRFESSRAEELETALPRALGRSWRGRRARYGRTDERRTRSQSDYLVIRTSCDLWTRSTRARCMNW